MSNDEHLLKTFDKLVTELNDTQGTNAKIDILREQVELQPLIKRIWDPNTKTHVTKKGLETWAEKHDVADYTGIPSNEVASLYDLLDRLTSGQLSGDRAKASIWCFIKRHCKYEELILRICEKNPRIRLGETMLLKAFPGMFQIFKVCLAQEYTEADFAKAFAATKGAWISKKIDGMRLITKITASTKKGELADVHFYSRKGNEVTSLDVLRKDLMRHLIPHLDRDEIAEGRVLDGEVIALNPDGTENFKLTISEARKKDVNMPDPQYLLFDYMPLAVFEERERGEHYGDRLENLQDFEKVMPKRCRILEQTPWTKADFDRLAAEAKEKNWEGLMLRFNSLYEAKRSRALLKYKFTCSEEYKVEELIIDEEYPVANKSGGEDRVRAVSAVIIKHKGNNVQVGSGFDKAERIDFAAHPEKIRGKIISVKFQEEFYDEKKKTASLRCPIYQGIVGDEEREV